MLGLCVLVCEVLPGNLCKSVETLAISLECWKGRCWYLSFLCWIAILLWPFDTYSAVLRSCRVNLCFFGAELCACAAAFLSCTPTFLQVQASWSLTLPSFYTSPSMHRYQRISQKRPAFWEDADAASLCCGDVTDCGHCPEVLGKQLFLRHACC